MIRNPIVSDLADGLVAQKQLPSFDEAAIVASAYIFRSNNPKAPFPQTNNVPPAWHIDSELVFSGSKSMEQVRGLCTQLERKGWIERDPSNPDMVCISKDKTYICETIVNSFLS